jgi:hypothetical protein
MQDDLSALFSVDAPTVMTLEHPQTFLPLIGTGGKPMQVMLLGSDTEAVRAVEKKIANDMLERASRSRGGRFKMDSDTSDRYARQRFLARIAGWANLVVAGKPFDFSEDNKVRLYDDLKFGPIRRQIEAFMADEGNFLATSETNLSIN